MNKKPPAPAKPVQGKSQGLKKSLANDEDDDFNYWEDAAESDDIGAEWKRFVHRIRVHEMLKCLREEHKKLRVGKIISCILNIA